MARAKKMEKDMRVSNKAKLLAHNAGVDSNSALVKNGMAPEDIKKVDEIRAINTSSKSASVLTEEIFKKYEDDIYNGVPNELERYIKNNIIAIKELIDNIVKYSDPRIFEFLPSEFIEKAKTYGWVAQEYVDKLLNRMSGQKVLVVPTYYLQCRHCHTSKSPNKFYKIYSDAYDGYSILCKECANKLLVDYIKKYKDIREALLLLSHKLDLYVYVPVLDKYCKKYDEAAGKQSIEDGTFLSDYIGDINVQRHYYPDLKKFSFENSRFGGVPFKCINTPVPVPAIYHDNFKVEVVKEIDVNQDNLEDDDTPLSDSMAKKLEYKFGKYDHQDLKWLERKYKEWDNIYDISQLNAQKLIIQMCCDELLIVRQREQGLDVSKQFKAFKETMNYLNLTPKQQAKDANSNNFTTITDFIREVEKRKPVATRSKEWEDIDGIMRYVVATSGAMARTLDKANDLTEDFEKLYKDFTLDVLDVDNNASEIDYDSIDLEDGDEDAEI